MTALEALADKLRAQALAGELSAPDGVVEVRLERRLVREDRRPCEVGERWCSELATIELHSRAGVVALLRPARRRRPTLARADVAVAQDLRVRALRSRGSRLTLRAVGLLPDHEPAPRLLGLCGYKYAGKSTAGRLAEDGWGFTRTRLAGPIKAAAIACGVPAAYVDGSESTKECPLPTLGGKSARAFMELLGDWGRSTFGEDFWLRQWGRGADALIAQGRGLLLVDDVRYDDEDAWLAEWAESRGVPYLLVQVSAPDREDRTPSHRSNRTPDPSRIARAVDNSRATCPTTADLRARVLHTVEEWDARLRAGLAPTAGRTPRW